MIIIINNNSILIYIHLDLMIYDKVPRYIHIGVHVVTIKE